MNTLPSNSECRKRDTVEAVNPANLPAERCVLGAIIEDDSLWDEVIASGLCRRHLFLDDHRHVFGAIERLKARNAPVDYISVAEELGNRAQDYVLIASLVHGVVVQEDHVRHHAAIVRKKSCLRALLKMGEWITTSVTETSDPDLLTKQIRSMLDACTEDHVL
ncbi:MAG TPA: DnaB-like helicase N-terminal domain-containing protein [Candidatus Sulfotelmatobacter sp.]|nr:DnaB-like helicase N-terminal domain-containing protein [Candidatus Sulfotelmatobacter sp.]